MIKGIFYASRNFDSQFKNMEIVSNNLANINTVGYKREAPFVEIMNRYKETEKKQITNFDEGELISTNNPLDLAITGNGFFMLKTPYGYELTKNGRFKISEDGYLINEQGYRVMGKNGEISFGDSFLRINEDNHQAIIVSKNGEVREGDKIIDQLRIVIPSNNDDLYRTEGLNFYSINSDYIDTSEKEFEVIQGALEGSNVNPVIELSAMLKIDKDFEASQKMVNTLDNNLSKTVEIGRL